MRFELRHRVIRAAFLGALVTGAGGAQALAAGQTPVVAAHAQTAAQQKGGVSAGAARTTKPAAPAVAKKTVAPTPVAPRVGTAAAPAPATGPKTEARKGRGHF